MSHVIDVVIVWLLMSWRIIFFILLLVPPVLLVYVQLNPASQHLSPLEMAL